VRSDHQRDPAFHDGFKGGGLLAVEDVAFAVILEAARIGLGVVDGGQQPGP
jgi:hypothetical protein